MRPPTEAQAKRMADLGYVTIPEACERLGLSRSSLYSAIRDGKVETSSVGPRKYVRVESLLSYAGPTAKTLWEGEGEDASVDPS